jgi:hypothetical protein
MYLKSVDETIALLKELAEESGYAPFASGSLAVGAEWFNGAVVFYIGSKRATEQEVKAAIHHARATRFDQLPR